ncbi:MAG TPA: hypothetical protein DCR69_04415 [Clostridium sp.]|nr:hypothetical protein [Clostridium sp.]
MLSYFPQIRNEESTYSIFSRLQFALQPHSMQIMGKLLFDKNTEVGRLNFQGSFDYLCNNLPLEFTSESFLHNNTIYPFLMLFLSTQKQERALTYFKANNPKKLSSCLKLSCISNRRTYIRVCRECIKEDFNLYGEPYYRRQHEIELNRMCHKHRVPLYEYTIFPYKIPRRYDDYYTVLSNSKEIFIPNEFKEKFLDIAEDINTIFTSNLKNWNVQLTNAKIITRFSELMYLSRNISKPNSSFFQDFQKYYTEDFLNYIGYNFDQNSFQAFYRNITMSKPIEDPLMHFLFIKYLFGCFDEFIKYNKKYSSFPSKSIVFPKPNNEYLQ